MRITNISNQGVILRRTNTEGGTDVVRVGPGAQDVHEMWTPQIEAHPLLVIGEAVQTITTLVEPPPTEKPSDEKVDEKPARVKRQG